MNGSNSGWLNVRYYYIRQLKRKQERDEMLNGSGGAESVFQIPDDNYNAKDDVEQLKSLIVCSRNWDIIREKLNRTREYRAQMLKRKETELKEHFPYFFTHPLELVRLFSCLVLLIYFFITHIPCFTPCRLASIFYEQHNAISKNTFACKIIIYN